MGPFENVPESNNGLGDGVLGEVADGIEPGWQGRLARSFDAATGGSEGTRLDYAPVAPVGGKGLAASGLKAIGGRVAAVLGAQTAAQPDAQRALEETVEATPLANDRPGANFGGWDAPAGSGGGDGGDPKGPLKAIADFLTMLTNNAEGIAKGLVALLVVYTVGQLFTVNIGDSDA